LGKVLRMTKKTIAGEGGVIWVKYEGLQKMYMLGWNYLIIHLFVWRAPSSKVQVSETPLPLIFHWNIRLSARLGSEKVETIEFILNVYTASLGKRGIVKQLHSNDSIYLSEVKEFESESVFIDYFLKKVGELLSLQKKKPFTEFQKYYRNWVLASFRFYEMYGGKMIDLKTGEMGKGGIYLRILPVGIYEEGVLRPHGEGGNMQKFVAVVRTPYFTLAFPTSYYRDRSKPPEEGMTLHHLIHSRFGIDTPFITPTLMKASALWVNSGVIIPIEESLTRKEVALSPPLSMLSILEEGMLPLIVSYLQQVGKAKTDLEAPDAPLGKKYAMLIYILIFAFYAVLSGVLKSVGYDFVATMPDEGVFTNYWEAPNKYLWFRVAMIDKNVIFECKKLSHSKSVKFIFNQTWGVNIRGEEWEWWVLPTIEFRKEDGAEDEKVRFILTQEEAMNAIMQREVAKQVLLNFARQVQEYLRKVPV